MKLLIFFILFSFSMVCQSVLAQEIQQVVPYTLADRDRAIRTEARMEGLETKIEALETKVDTKFIALETKMDVKFESQQRQLDDIKSLFYWGFGIIITLIIFMLGYTIWDRRTALTPALEQSTLANEKVRDLYKVLRKYAKKHPDLTEILKTYGVL